MLNIEAESMLECNFSYKIYIFFHIMKESTKYSKINYLESIRMFHILSVALLQLLGTHLKSTNMKLLLCYIKKKRNTKSAVEETWISSTSWQLVAHLSASFMALHIS